MFFSRKLIARNFLLITKNYFSQKRLFLKIFVSAFGFSVPFLRKAVLQCAILDNAYDLHLIIYEICPRELIASGKFVALCQRNKFYPFKTQNFFIKRETYIGTYCAEHTFLEVFLIILHCILLS